MASARLEATHSEACGVVKRLVRCLSKTLVLADHRNLVKDRPFRGVEQCVKSAKNSHGQNDGAVLATDIEIAEGIVGDAPEAYCDLVELRFFIAPPPLFLGGLTIGARGVPKSLPDKAASDFRPHPFVMFLF